jgi:chemotaxis protein MotB
MKGSNVSSIIFRFACIPILIVLLAAGVQAALFYSPSEYNAIYNEKVALELEIKSLKRQFGNERTNLEAKIRQLESTIDSLKERIDLLEKQSAEDKRLAAERIKELEKRTDILQKKGSEREKQLVDENRDLQNRYESEIEKLKKDFQNERDGYLKKMDSMRSEHQSEIAKLQKEIANLNNELAELKQLNKFQKEELNRMEAQANELEKQLEDEIKRGEIRLKKFHDRLIINLDDRICFDSGSAKLKPDILPALNKITKILSTYPENRIVVEGHTDNVPIHTARFRDNWELSTERALSVLNYILKNKNLKPGRFSAAGYGEHNPILPNNSDENRALNRRVDIVVIPRVTQKD